jgi:ABC-type branched-subunit amino acid transport system ATPase component
MTSNPALIIRDLRVQFGGIKAIDGLDCTVEEGTITGLIGPNGSGKTTLLNTITGMTEADEGSIVFHGHAIQGLKPHAIARQGIGRTFQITRLFPQMSVLDNLLVAQQHQKGETVWFAVLGPPSVRVQERQTRDKALGFLDFTGLTRLQDAPASTLSYGQQKLLEIARVMMLDPRLILLDEPFAGVNPTNIERLIAFIVELNRDRGITIVLVEHMMKIMMRLAQTIIVLKAGRVIATGTPAEVQVHPAAIEAYLGV